MLFQKCLHSYSHCAVRYNYWYPMSRNYQVNKDDVIISNNLHIVLMWHCLFTCITSVVHLSTFLQTAKSFNLKFWWQHYLKQHNPSNRYDSEGYKLFSRWVALPSLQLQVKILYFTSSRKKWVTFCAGKVSEHAVLWQWQKVSSRP